MVMQKSRSKFVQINKYTFFGIFADDIWYLIWALMMTFDVIIKLHQLRPWLLHDQTDMTHFLVMLKLRSNFVFHELHLVCVCLLSTLTLLQWAFSAPPAERKREWEGYRERERELVWGGRDGGLSFAKERVRERKHETEITNILYYKKP